jgi:hypothetical protein
VSKALPLLVVGMEERSRGEVNSGMFAFLQGTNLRLLRRLFDVHCLLVLGIPHSVAFRMGNPVAQFPDLSEKLSRFWQDFE